MTDEEKVAADTAKAKKKAEDDAAAEAERKRAAAPKVELTADELQARIDAATTSAVKAAAEKQAKRDEEAKAKSEEEEAKKRGEFESLAQKADAKREAAESERDNMRRELRRRDVQDMIGAHLREHHKEYAGAGVEKYIMPQVEFDLDTKPEEITKRVKDAADQYVKDNPRGGKSNGPPPPNPRTPQRGEPPQRTGAPARARSVAASRF